MCGYKKNTDEYNGGYAFSYDKNDINNLPAEMDWRISGAVTPVKGILNQIRCEVLLKCIL